jgi:hypothetical protein
MSQSDVNLDNPTNIGQIQQITTYCTQYGQEVFPDVAIIDGEK